MPQVTARTVIKSMGVSGNKVTLVGKNGVTLLSATVASLNATGEKALQTQLDTVTAQLLGEYLACHVYPDGTVRVCLFRNFPPDPKDQWWDDGPKV